MVFVVFGGMGNEYGVVVVEIVVIVKVSCGDMGYCVIVKDLDDVFVVYYLIVDGKVE